MKESSTFRSNVIRLEKTVTGREAPRSPVTVLFLQKITACPELLRTGCIFLSADIYYFAAVVGKYEFTAFHNEAFEFKMF